MTRRRLPLIVLAVGALLAAGALAVAFGPMSDLGQPHLMNDPLALPITLTTLPSNAMPVAGQGISVVSPAIAPTTPARAQSPPLAIDRDAVRAAEVRIRVGEMGFGPAFDRAASIAVTFGGFVASSTSLFDEEGSAGQLVLRVPVANFDAARRAVADLGAVEGETIRGQDVSAQVVDQEARQRSLEAQEEALRILVGRANSVSEVLQVQPALSSVRQQIEQLRAQRASLEDAAALSSILVTIREPGASGPAPDPDRGRPGLRDRVEQAVDGALAVVGGAVVILGWATPFVAAAALVWLAVRSARRRARTVEG